MLSGLTKTRMYDGSVVTAGRFDARLPRVEEVVASDWLKYPGNGASTQQEKREARKKATRQVECH